MLRLRLSGRSLFRFYNFKTSTYTLPGHKTDIELSEENRRIKHTLETWEKDPKYLLSEIDKIYNPYKELGIPKEANQAEINRIINLRRAQITKQIETEEEKKQISSGKIEENNLESFDNKIVAIDTQE